MMARWRKWSPAGNPGSGERFAHDLARSVTSGLARFQVSPPEAAHWTHKENEGAP